MSNLVHQAFEKSRRSYGTRRIKTALSHQGQSVRRRRIGSLMREAGLMCKTKRRFNVTTDSKHDLPIAPNHLDRQFAVDQANQVYVGDITYIYTQEG
ncbi:IS3 family transposase [Methylomonas sp. SURF-1]|uniref:IS3 family transposase n=1 Tax=Methylomonas aurea TaxID=2952224 RepID=A0ABT1UGH1_9GAMM|nr:IS3 family transposase [Methylomonas sp. SURF-1]MCQ8181327.1 IS3 family transposase [Methylomonas sp. SURF-1]